MSLTTITKVGAFTDDVAKQINDNFTSLGSSTAGGTLTSGHLLIGSAGNVATDTVVSGDATLIASGALTVATVNGMKLARGITPLDGSNPTTVATGLTTVLGFATCLNNTAGVNTGTAFVTYGTISGGNVPIYGWVAAGTASSGTDNVAWVAIGT
jgi:hypothetical protein